MVCLDAKHSLFTFWCGKQDRQIDVSCSCVFHCVWAKIKEWTLKEIITNRKKVVKSKKLLILKEIKIVV